MNARVFCWFLEEYLGENIKAVMHSSPVMSCFSKTEEKLSDNLPFEDTCMGEKGIGAVGLCFLIVFMSFRSDKSIRKCPSHTRNGLNYLLLLLSFSAFLAFLSLCKSLE